MIFYTEEITSELYYDEKPALLKAFDNKDKVFILRAFQNFYLDCALHFYGYHKITTAKLL